MSMPDDLEAVLLNYLRTKHRGQEKRVTRGQLVWAMKTCGFEVGDRQVRDAIEKLRAEHPDGPCIISSSRLDGYFWSDELKDIQGAQAEDVSRIASTRAKMDNRDRYLRRRQEENVMVGRLL